MEGLLILSGGLIHDKRASLGSFGPLRGLLRLIYSGLWSAPSLCIILSSMVALACASSADKTALWSLWRVSGNIHFPVREVGDPRLGLLPSASQVSLGLVDV